MLEVKNIYKSFGENQVLKGVNFSVEKGDVIAVLGSSGSGKTTLLKCISFLEPADKGEITFDDFAKLQFQVGEIIACEAVKKSKKLLCSQVKIGNQVRQIVSGIRKHYSPEEMVGKKVMVVTNLKPATLAGVKSEGMILCAEDADGNLSLMVPEKKMPAGAEIC